MNASSLTKCIAGVGVILSTVVCVGIIVMWCMSYQYFDMFHSTTASRIFDVESCRGELQVVLVQDDLGSFNLGRRKGNWTREGVTETTLVGTFGRNQPTTR